MPQFSDAEKFTKALVSGNKLAAELLKKATALQTKLQMIEQVGVGVDRCLTERKTVKCENSTKWQGTLIRLVTN